MEIWGWGPSRLGLVIRFERNPCWDESPSSPYCPLSPPRCSAAEPASLCQQTVLSLCTVLKPSSIIPTASNPSPCALPSAFFPVLTLPLSTRLLSIPSHAAGNCREGHMSQEGT